MLWISELSISFTDGIRDFKSKNSGSDVTLVYYNCIDNKYAYTINRKHLSDTSYYDFKVIDGQKEDNIIDVSYYYKIGGSWYRKNHDLYDRDFNVDDFKSRKSFSRKYFNDSVVCVYEPIEVFKINGEKLYSYHETTSWIKYGTSRDVDVIFHPILGIVQTKDGTTGHGGPEDYKLVLVNVDIQCPEHFKNIYSNKRTLPIIAWLKN